MRKEEEEGWPTTVAKRKRTRENRSVKEENLTKKSGNQPSTFLMLGVSYIILRRTVNGPREFTLTLLPARSTNARNCLLNWLSVLIVC